MCYERVVRRGVATLVVSLAFAGCAEGPTEPDRDRWTDSEFDFTEDVIAFETEREGNKEIYLVTVDGSDGINITNIDWKRRTPQS